VDEATKIQHKETRKHRRGVLPTKHRPRSEGEAKKKKKMMMM